jgi:hypothetical protein
MDCPKRSVSICLIITGMVILPHLASNAQDVQHSLKDGSWALQFCIGENFSLSSFEGMNLSVKKHLKSHHALRFGIDFGGDNIKLTDALDDDVQSLSAEATEKAHYLRLAAHYLFYPRSTKSIHVFFGTGPFFGLLMQNQESGAQDLDTDPSQEDRVSEMDLDSWMLGASFIIGVEWFVKKEISLTAEYGTSFSYAHSRIDRVAEGLVDQDIILQTTSREVSHYKFEANQVKLGVSVYF